MRYCVEHALPHSEFLSWEDEDQDKVIAFLMWDGQRCGHCGTHPDEWIDEDKRRAADPPYVVGARMCYGCATLEDAREEIPKADRGIIHLHLKRNPEHERKRRGSPRG